MSETTKEDDRIDADSRSCNVLSIVAVSYQSFKCERKFKRYSEEDSVSSLTVRDFRNMQYSD